MSSEIIKSEHLVADDSKPTTDGEDQKISFNIVNNLGSSVAFRVKLSTEFNKVMSAYCTRNGIEFGSIKFLFDGNQLRPDQTIRQIGLSEGDVVDVMASQVGGVVFIN